MPTLFYHVCAIPINTAAGAGRGKEKLPSWEGVFLQRQL